MPIRRLPARAPLALAAGLLATTLALTSAAFAETRAGTSGPDILTGAPGASTLKGLAGNDVLYGDPVAGTGKPRKIERVSQTSAGKGVSKWSSAASVTADGRTMLFTSSSPEYLPAGVDGHNKAQLYTKDLVTGKVTLISTVNGAAFNGDVSVSTNAQISPDGRFVAFKSIADIMPGVSFGSTYQLVLKNLKTGVYTLVSQSPDGEIGSYLHSDIVFSPDSTMLAFSSNQPNLGPNDSNGQRDVFVVKLAAPTTVYRASTTVDGGLAQMGGSEGPVFSPDSKSLAFKSVANNLIANDANGTGTDLFLKSLTEFDASNRIVKGEVSLIDTSATGAQKTSGGVFYYDFSPDGREVAFISNGAGLVPGDTTSGGDIFIKTIKDGVPARPKGTIRIVSRSTSGDQADGIYLALAFSPDGTKLAFTGQTNTLVAGVGGQHYQVLVKDLTRADDKGAVTLVSRNTAGGPGNQGSYVRRFLGHGDRLLFNSPATDIIAADSNGTATDIFVATLAAPTGGNDVISGGPGNDVIHGGPGADRLTGGKGADRFVYLSTADSRPRKSKRDTITDFKVAQGDVIDLSAIDANARKAGNQAFTFIGRKPFDGKPGRLRFANGILSADTTGNRKANFAVKMKVTGKLTGKSIVK